MELQRGKKILDPFMHDPKVNKGIDVCDLQNKKNKYFEYYIHKNSVRYKNHSSINIVLSIEKKSLLVNFHTHNTTTHITSRRNNREIQLLD
jgi:hypothetical protein